MLKADTVIEMLLNASDQMSQHLEVTSARRRHGHDAHTLLRVLCHKKDKISSTFLRIQYHLPRSSESATEEVVYEVIAEPQEQTELAPQAFREDPAQGPVDTSTEQQ